MNTVKLTKKDYFNGMIAFLNGDACDIPVADMVAFCDKEIASLDTRAAKAKERAAAKRPAKAREEQPAIQNQAASTTLGDIDALAALKAKMESGEE